VEVDEISIKQLTSTFFFSNRKIVFLYKKLLYTKREADKLVS